MKLSRLQIRRLVEQVMKESDESKINKKDIGNALVAGPLYALLRKRQRRVDSGEVPEFKYEDGDGKAILQCFALSGAFATSLMAAGDLAAYYELSNRINPSDFSGQSIVVDADTESESNNVMETLDDMGIDYEVAADGLNVVILDGEQIYTVMLDDYRPFQNLGGLDAGAMDYHEDMLNDPYKDFDKDDPIGTYDLPDQFTGMGDPAFEYRPEYGEASFDEEMGEDPTGDYYKSSSRRRKRRRRR